MLSAGKIDGDAGHIRQARWNEYCRGDLAFLLHEAVDHPSAGPLKYVSYFMYQD